MKVLVKGYVLNKKSELFYDCADRYAYDKSQNKFAISDGVSKSFFPKNWAEILVRNWVNNNWESDEDFIKHCQTEWIDQITEIVSKPDTKYYTKNAFNRRESGLATFVGLRFFKRGNEWFWKANALGDSFLFYLPKGALSFAQDCIVLSSKKAPIIFDNFPDYLCSIGDNHKGEKQVEENPLQCGTFYLMTDALAEWFLNEKMNAVSDINLWENQKDFERFIEEVRDKEKLGNDDSAILIIDLDNDNDENLNYYSENVSDINELIKTQQKGADLLKEPMSQEIINHTKAPNSRINTTTNEERKASREKLFEEIEGKKTSKSFLKRIFGKGKVTEDAKPNIGNKELEQNENIEIIEEEESLLRIEEDLLKPEQLKNDNNRDESEKIIPNKPSQNVTDKF